MKYIVLFDRFGTHAAIYEGTVEGVKKFALDFMYYPVRIGKRTAFISHAAIWEYDENTRCRSDKCIGCIDYGVIGYGQPEKMNDVRVGLFWDGQTDKHYILFRNGTVYDEVDNIDYHDMIRRELRTRAARVKKIPESMQINEIPSCPICGGIA